MFYIYHTNVVGAREHDLTGFQDVALLNSLVNLSLMQFCVFYACGEIMGQFDIPSF